MFPHISSALLDDLGYLCATSIIHCFANGKIYWTTEKSRYWVLTIGTGAVALKPRDIQFGRPYERVAVWWTHCGDLMRTYLIDVGYVFLNSISGANIEWIFFRGQNRCRLSLSSHAVHSWFTSSSGWLHPGHCWNGNMVYHVVSESVIGNIRHVILVGGLSDFE